MGADPAKLILGMGTYGRSFTLNSASNNGLKAPAENPGNGGAYTNEPGMVGYNEVFLKKILTIICKLINFYWFLQIIELQNQGGWTVVWDEEQQVPHMTKGNQWIGYDDPKSIKIKVNY